MFNFNNSSNCSIVCFSSMSISHNGNTFGIKKLYTNMNGLENNYSSFTLPKNFHNYIDNQYSNENKFFKRNLKELDDIEQIKSEKRKKKFLADKKNLLEKMEKLNLQEEKKLEELQQQQQSEEDFDLKSETDLNDTYMRTEIDKLYKNYREEKNNIDNKNKFKKQNIEMDKRDKEKINNYKDKINQLKRYSTHSNFNKIVKKFDLDKYI